MKLKIEIKHFITGAVLFEFETEDNTLKKTLEKAVVSGAYLSGADLRGADLRGADLRGADLRGAYLSGAYLRGAYLSGAYLRGADLSGAYLSGAYLSGADLRGADLRGADLSGADLSGADLRGADLRGADLRGAYLSGAYLSGADFKKIEDIPQAFLFEASREMLFIFEHLKSEVPYLREKLIKGEVDGTKYEGDCACLIGSLGRGDNEKVKKVCEVIPYYSKGLHNVSEQWFWQIKKGDTPKTNIFAKHALILIDQVLGKEPAKTKK